MSKTNDEARRRGVPLGGVDCGEGMASTLLVRTMGVGAEPPPPIGRIMTSPPSKLRAASPELSSTSAVTASALTMTGYTAAIRWLTHSDESAKSLNSDDLEWRLERKWVMVWRTAVWLRALSPSLGNVTMPVSQVCSKLHAGGGDGFLHRVSMASASSIDLARGLPFDADVLSMGARCFAGDAGSS